MFDDFKNVKKNLGIVININKICVDGKEMGKRFIRCFCDFYEREKNI